MKTKKVIIIGGGFAGISTAKLLSKKKNLDILMIDRNNHHVFQPLLYQVATATLNPGDISFPLRVLFAKDQNVSVLMGEVNSIDLDHNRVHVGESHFDYDYLVMGAGAETNYFGNDQWREFTYELKTIDDAVRLRNKLLSLLEEKELKQEKNLNISIIGAGPTGVELAGSIGEFFKFTTQNEFRHLNPSKFKVNLIDKAPRMLAVFSEESSQKSQAYLASLGVTFMPGSDITDISAGQVKLRDGTLESDLIIWTAGVKAKTIEAMPGLKMDRSSKVICKTDLAIRDYPNVFVCGDQATMEELNFPAVAPVAIQQGECVALNILNDLENAPRKKFEYHDKGSMAVIGRKFAVAKIKGFEFTGFFAWLIWCFVHVFPLISFRSRMLVFIEFVWSYFNFRRGVRIITKLSK